MKLIKIFFVSVIVSLFFFYGANVLEENLENYFFAQISAPIEQQNAVFENSIKQHKQELISELSEPNIKAKSYISIKIDEQGNSEVLSEQNSEQILPIASLTKLMVAYMVFKYPEYYDFSKPVAISKKAVSQEENFGQLRWGEKISIENLLHFILIESSNDAAYALSEVMGEQTEPFVGLMNLEAEKNLLLAHTFFVNSTGLDPENLEEPKNVSCAKDLAKLSKIILQRYPEIFEISKKMSFKAGNGSGQLHHFVKNKNKLLDPNYEICHNDDEWLAQIPNIVGGKTGYTDEAKGCVLLVNKNRKGDYIVNVILGAITQEARFVEMKELVKWSNQRSKIEL
ncbi:D-alanyl-D-alanine carboxypeptidase [Candidatus Parcubacteria bacterium]|nr:D-alanyl-D-alanine carboxypeptidase [Candidatus Parcubacteria bacterium]